MFTVFTTLLQQILTQICALESDIPKQTVRWKQKALVAYLHLYMAVQDCEAALFAAVRECLAITNGTTPVVKIVLNKRLVELHDATIVVCQQLSVLESFLPSYANDTMIYLLDMQQKVPNPLPMSLLSAACPILQRQVGHLSSIVQYPLHQPTTAQVAVTPPLQAIRTVPFFREQERFVILVEQGSLTDVQARVLEAVQQHLPKQAVDMRMMLQDDRALASAMTECAGITAHRIQLGALIRHQFELSMLVQ